MNVKLKEINSVLLALFGREELVQRWWTSPNFNFGLRYPQEVWDSGEEDEIWNYVMTHGYR